MLSERGAPPSTTLRRTIEPYLAPEESAKVKVLEGARAVGKTTVGLRLVDAGVYDSMVRLDEAAALADARADIVHFLDHLPDRVIIDEAQLAPDLSLHVKRLVDEPGTPRRFLLMGSARIARDSLGGADPLAGRVERWTLDPLTTPERLGAPDLLGRIIDDLFEPEPPHAHLGPFPTRPPAAWITTAGLPLWTLGSITQSRRIKRIGDWKDSVIGTGLLPADGRVDSVRARRILDALLLKTATPFASTTVGNSLGLDARTVGRYLTFFERRFCFRLLPNLALSPRHQGIRGAKIHAIDAGLVQHSLTMTDPGMLRDPRWIGHLFETWVVNQLIAATQFSHRRVEAFTWREVPRGKAEVDLVLVAPDGRRVGIEVKSSGAVGHEDARGLRALKESGDFHAGFVIHTGTSVEQLAERIWALPAGVLAADRGLGDQGLSDVDGGSPYMPGQEIAFPGPSAREGTRPQAMGRASEAQPTDANEVFDAYLVLSYVHADDEYLGAAITTFAKNLEEAYSAHYAGTIKVFTDKRDIPWGATWREQITAEIDETTFLLAAVTPRFLKSEECRREVATFLAQADAAGQPRLLLPLIVLPIDDVEGVLPNDPILLAINGSQWLDLTRDFATLALGTADGRASMAKIVKELRLVVKAREGLASPRETGQQNSPANEPARGLGNTPMSSEKFDGFLDEYQDRQAAFESAGERLGSSLTRIMEALTPVFEDMPTTMKPGALANTRHTLEPLIKELEADTRDLSDAWAGLAAPLRELTTSPAFLSGDDALELHDGLLAMAEGLVLEDTDMIKEGLLLIGRMSRMLRPSMRAVSGAFSAIAAIRTSMLEWAAMLA